MLSAIFNRLPLAVRAPLSRRHFQLEVQGGNLASPASGFRNLSNYLRPGECAIDVGARAGHVTLRMADIVGEAGRVVAFEPDVEVFEQLCARVRRPNVKLSNGTPVIDELHPGSRVALLKIDARGPDEVLKGAEGTIARDRPTLLVESQALPGWLREHGYRGSRQGRAPYLVARAL